MPFVYCSVYSGLTERKNDNIPGFPSQYLNNINF